MIAISSGTSSAAEDVGGQVVNLLAVLVANNGPTSGSGIGRKHDSILHKSISGLRSRQIWEFHYLFKKSFTLFDQITYLEDNTANSGSSLHGLDGGLTHS